MKREAYEQLLDAAKAEAVATLGDNPSSQRIQHAMDILAQRVAAVTRDYHLLNLMSVEELAQRLAVSDRAVRYLLDRRHTSDGIGRRIGKNTWIVDIDELPALESDRRQKQSGA